MAPAKKPVTPELLDEMILKQREALRKNDEAFINIGEDINSRARFEALLTEKTKIQAEINRLNKKKKELENAAKLNKEKTQRPKKSYRELVAEDAKLNNKQSLDGILASETDKRNDLKKDLIAEEKKRFIESPQTYKYKEDPRVREIIFSAYKSTCAEFLIKKGIKDSSSFKIGQKQFLDIIQDSCFDRAFTEEINNVVNPLNWNKEKERRRSFDDKFVSEYTEKAFETALKESMRITKDGISSSNSKKAEMGKIEIDKNEKIAQLAGTENVYHKVSGNGKTYREQIDSVQKSAASFGRGEVQKATEKPQMNIRR